MKVLIFGATGMVGQGVLRECLRADDVETVQTVGRGATGIKHAKLREWVQTDLLDYAAAQGRLAGYHACFFCLGASTVGLDEAQYTRINYEIPLAAANALVQLNPGMTFIYVSGQGTGSRQAMWAQVKARTEHALLQLPFKAAYMFRPGVIQPVHGARSKTPLYRAFYALGAPLLGASRRLWPQQVLTTEEIGLAMLEVTRHGAPHPILEAPDLRALAERAAHVE